MTPDDFRRLALILPEADEPTLRGALEAAWRLKANKRQIALLEASRAPAPSLSKGEP